MFICSVCGDAFFSENELTTHFLKCWKLKNPYHQSKSAPRTKNIEERTGANQIMDFLEGLKCHK